MELRSIRDLSLVLAIVAAGLGWLGVAAEPPGDSPTFHLDGPATGEAALAAAGALLRDDRPAARAALARLKAAHGQLAPEEFERYPSGWRILDQALHRVLANTREYVGADEMEQAFDEFVWAQRTCRHCHRLARDEGLLPTEGPFWAAEAGSPKDVESTQSVREKP
jgi:hypothetical protein